MAALTGLIVAVAGQAHAALVNINITGPGVSGSIVVTYGAATDAKYPNAYEVTGISGVFSDSNNGLGIVNAAISSLVAITHAAPEPKNHLAPDDFSKYAVAFGLPPDDKGVLTYDNLFWPGGSPPTASDYTAHGGFLDIYGLMFTLDNGMVVDFWSNGDFGGTADYGVAVATSAAALDYVGGNVLASTTTVSVVEYHHASFDHYFITSKTDEIAILDSKVPPFQEWSRTGLSFNAYANAGAPAGSVGICRFFNDSAAFAPKSSHFYAPHGLGCEDTIASFPDWKLENDKLFNAMLPDGSGKCPIGTIPVYRLYNNGQGGAPNHRFTTSKSVQQTMLAQGYVAEPAGIGVGMCVPP
ncbi:MAG: hypothetical protein ABI607_11825 [Betaproteobacteria bacterium]